MNLWRRMWAALGEAAAALGPDIARGGRIQQISIDSVFAPAVGGDWREVKLATIGDVVATGEVVHKTNL